MIQSKFLFERAQPYRWQLLAISALSLAGSFAILAVPWLGGQLLGGILQDENLQLGSVVTMLVVALLANTAFSVAASILSAHTSGQILADLRLETYAHVQSLPIGFHDGNRQGDLLALMSYEVNHLSEFLATTLAGLPAMLVTAVGSVILLFLIDPVIALFIPILLPAFFIILKVVGRHLRHLASQAREADAKLVTIAEEDLELLPAVKAFAVEKRHRLQYQRLARDSFILGFRQARINAVMGPAIALIASVAAIALLIAVEDRTGANAKSATELFSMLLYAALLTRPVASLANVYGSFQWAKGTLSRLASVLSIPSEPGLLTGRHLERSNGAIVFDKVSFGYPGREPVLRELDLVIREGEIVALTGLNGAGKSTLINLLMRFYGPKRGRILLDGQDIGDAQVQSLRRQIGLVPQSPLLFNGTILQNITMGRPDANDAEIAEALSLAQADEFVAALPNGLATEIGDHGVRLSGGQRQRIALARALLPNPPILIFDEATAMYDLAGEEAFVAACQTALQDRTVIIVTHRRASLALADRIIRIEDGGAVESEGSYLQT